jgi:hypothetical protein
MSGRAGGIIMTRPKRRKRARAPETVTLTVNVTEDLIAEGIRRNFTGAQIIELATERALQALESAERDGGAP